MERMFYQCQSLKEITFSDAFQTFNVKSFKSMFNSCKQLKSIDLQYFKALAAEDMSLMFNDCTNLESLDLSNFEGDTYNVKTFSHMFAGCEKLRRIDFNFDASQATDLSYLFFGCTSLETVYIKSTKIAENLNIDYMFFNCINLAFIDFGSVRFKISNMEYTFHGCAKLQAPDFTNFDVREVESMQSLFYGCKTFSKLKLLTFHTTKCHNFIDMFAECNEMTLDIYEDYNKELIESLPYYVHVKGKDGLKQINFLLDE
jgi:hypothetical protein